MNYSWGVTATLTNYEDILLVRMTTDAIRPPEKQYRYPNALVGLVALVREEGIRGLTRGLGPNTVSLRSCNTLSAL